MINNRKIAFSLTMLLAIGIVFLLSFVNTCQRFEPDSMLVFTTDPVETLSEGNYKLNGTIVNIGDENIIQHGFCWAETNNPTIEGEASELGIKETKGSFSSTISGLSCEATYYVRAYVTNIAGTSYGKQVSFITQTCITGNPPVADFVASPTNITEGQSVQFMDQSTNTPTSWHWDFGDGSSSTTSNPSHLYSTAGSYTVTLTVTNSFGADFETKAGYITVTVVSNPPVADFTANPNQITEGQSVQFIDLSTNTPTSWHWDFGDGSSSTTSNPSHIYSTAGSYTVTLTVTNSFGSDSETKVDYITVTVVSNPPVADFAATPTNITEGQSVQFTDQSTNTPTSWSWDFGDGGTSTASNPSHIYSSVGLYTVSLTVTNGYGSDSKTKTGYITVTNNTVTDIDGNVYQIVQIGDQLWMAENLKTTRFADGSAIPLVETTGAWDALIATSKAYCWYDNSTASRDTYGGLYTWAAAMNGAGSSSANPSGVQGVCPDGWHLPSDAEWTELTDYLGGESVAGGKLKEAGTTHWNSPNTGATNSSGFTALPGGRRFYDGSFYDLGNIARFWTATENAPSFAWFRYMNEGIADVYRYLDDKVYGFSVRCLED